MAFRTLGRGIGEGMWLPDDKRKNAESEEGVVCVWPADIQTRAPRGLRFQGWGSAVWLRQRSFHASPEPPRSKCRRCLCQGHRTENAYRPGALRPRAFATFELAASRMTMRPDHSVLRSLEPSSGHLESRVSLLHFLQALSFFTPPHLQLPRLRPFRCRPSAHKRT
jgi:hypothetical protein